MVRRSASRRSAHPARRGGGDWPLGSAASGPGRLEYRIQRHKVWSADPIEVTAGTGASVAFVAVKDQSIGLVPDDLERIFDRFERAVPLPRVEGLGLGPWIARRVVKARGGVISAEGQPGQGALFTVRLPLTQASLFGAGRTAVDSHTILIVEDEQESRESLTELLELEGFNVVTATNGLEAWEYLHTSHQPSLIVLDVTMPVMDGRQFRQLQLKDDELAKIPTIVVSALSASATADLAALKAFRKPFFSKGDRAAAVIPEELSAKADEDERNPGKQKLILRFTLPRGSYATMIVKRLTQTKER